MATGKRASKSRQKNINTTFSVSSIDSTTVEEKLFGAVENGDAEDGPVVFICGKCKLPVGDSLSWDGSEDEENQIRLKRESECGNICRILDLESFRRKSRGLLLLFCNDCAVFRCPYMVSGNTTLFMVYLWLSDSVDVSGVLSTGVTDNVYVGKEKRLFEVGKRSAW